MRTGSLGRMWRAYMRQARKVNGWLVAQGLPTSLARATLVIVKLVVIGVLLYVVFWFALLLFFVLLVARSFAQYEQDEDLCTPQEELRHGEAGYGVYSSSG